ncbi:hypothetical protein D3C72_1428520 [compost metagenome]
MAAQVRPAHHARLGQRVVGAAHHGEVVAQEALHLDLGAGPLRRADAEVDVLAEDARQELVGCAVVHQHANFRVLLAEGAQRIGQ